MAEKLTKTAIKEQLSRRISWYEKTYGFDADTSSACVIAKKNGHLLIEFGRYISFKEMLWQIENNLFIDGFVN
jgi:hypothetical protein